MSSAWQTFKTAFLAFAGGYAGWKVCKYVDENHQEIKGDAEAMWQKVRARIESPPMPESTE